MSEASLPDADRRLARLFAACVLGAWDAVRAERRNAGAGEPDRRWREALLMVHVFAGVPRAVESYGVLDAAGGLGAPSAAELLEPTTGGAELFGRIYAEAQHEVRALLERYHPLFARQVVEHAYGRVLARPGLAADRRELLACAALAVLGQGRQLASHARGAVRCGARPEEVFEVVDAVADLAPPARIADAREVVRRFARP
ncbi:MAG: carboxymuconolactone decarboxylase family protein [Planctomycetes bacterium]|nr:carboxymuconolactone decarboxylase family protein [Planctomycetota bacterium]